jgi:hypothetical protein
VDDGSAWRLVEDWSREAGNPHALLPADDAAGVAALAGLDQLTEASVLGALARRAAALVVDDWLVVLGAGGDGWPGLADFNGPHAPGRIEGALIAGVDRLGGGFAINGGGLPAGDLGEVCFLGADDLSWLPTGLGHSAFVHWALTGDLQAFYEDVRWPGWREALAELAPGQGIFTYPPLWTAEGRDGEPSRGAVPLTEAWLTQLDAWRQLGRPSA